MNEIKTVGILGMGALGMLFGNLLTRKLGPGAVQFLMDGERYERCKNDVYTINGETVTLAKSRAEETGPLDLILVAVKYPALEASLDLLEKAVGPDTLILSLLNGISSEPIIAARFGADKVIHTVSQGMDAMRFGSALTYTKAGRLHVGVTDPAMEARLARLLRFFDETGFPYAREEDILYRMWSKFMLNVGINQTCMVFDCSYEKALVPGSEENVFFLSAMREVILLAQAEGVGLSEKELHEYIAIIRSLDPKAIPSMEQDRVNKKPTEVELFAGTVRALAARHGIPVPANDFLYRRAREIEAAYL